MTLSTTISVGPPLGFSNAALALPHSIHELKIDFQAGDHVYTSPDFELGVVKALNNHSLIGRLTFHYSYDATDRTITVCGTDYQSAEGMALITMPKDMEEHAHIERAAPSSSESANRSSHWNPHSKSMSGAADVLKRIVQTANEALIESLQADRSLNVRVRLPAPEISARQYLELLGVSEDKIPISEASAQEMVEASFPPWRSIFGGTVTFALNEIYANVLGSTPDPKPTGSTSWIGLWNRYYAPPLTVCSSFGYNGFVCSSGSTLVGGHVVKNATAIAPPAGSNNVYIIPICRAHNNVNFTASMSTVTNWRAIWLNNYLN